MSIMIILSRRRASKGEALKGGKKGTHNVLAAPVLMLRPAGPLAERANAMLICGPVSPDDAVASAGGSGDSGLAPHASLPMLLKRPRWNWQRVDKEKYRAVSC